MKRRHFIKSTIAISALAAISSGLFTSAASAAAMVDYKPGLIQKLLSEGKTVFVDYAADWCSTCASQERTIKRLRAENPDYEKMAFVRVDWDDFGNHEVSKSRNIPRRSTLIVLKGNSELGRIVAGTSKSSIKDLMDKGLASVK